jgi:6-methylsalicylate decarboxylase
MIDYPYEKTRTASDLTMSGRKRQNPTCKIILSHAGGTLPFLAKWLAHLSSTLFRKDQVEGGPFGDEIITHAKTFYFDTALAGSANILDALLKWALRDRILFGTGYLYAFESSIEYFTKGLEGDEMNEKGSDLLGE